MKTEELLARLRTRDLVLFGTGFVAEMFYRALLRHALEHRLRGCLVSASGTEGDFHGVPVFPLNTFSFPENTLLCVAVHESAEASLRGALSALPVETVWIYPFLHELLYGVPLAATELSLADILRRQRPDEYWLAVRYAVVRDWLEGRDTLQSTEALYRKALGLHCGAATAARRCGRMEELAVSMKEIGFREDCPVRVDERLRIIDGLHRIACAAYLGICRIPAVVYPATEIYDELLGEKNRLPAHVLLNAGFSPEETAVLQTAQKELLLLAETEPAPE